MVAALQCHADVKVCRGCIGWLMQNAGGIDVTPTLPVTNMAAAVAFYEAAGFDVERYDDGFAFVHWDDQSVFDLDLAEALDQQRTTPVATSSPTTSPNGTLGSPPLAWTSRRSRRCRGAWRSSPSRTPAATTFGSDAAWRSREVP